MLEAHRRRDEELSYTGPTRMGNAIAMVKLPAQRGRGKK
jgi:hypothetical protein